MAKTGEIKNPFLLRVLIYSFLVAPFGNIALTAISLGIKDWYEPRVFLNIITHIQEFDLAWLGLIFIVGVLLTTRHRTAWTSSIVVLLLSVLINVRNFVHIINSSQLAKAYLLQTSFSMIVTISVAGLFYYFRYPYLDRRATLLGFAPRFDVRIPSHLSSYYLKADCECQSLSISGARFVLENNPLNLNIGDEVQILLADLPEKFQATVVEHSNLILRLRFIDLSSAQKGQLIQLAKDHHQGKYSEITNSIKKAV